MPASAVVGGIVTIIIAVKSPNALVVDDYYKEGMAINQSLERDKNAAELGLSARLKIESTGDLITLNLNKGTLTGYPENLTLHFQHATHADQLVAA